MKLAPAVIAFVAHFASASQPPVRVDSPSVVALTATLPSGKIQLPAPLEPQAAKLIRNQLLYIVGHLNGWGGGADLANAKITILETKVLNTETVQVWYSAEITIAWPRASQWGKKLFTVLPLDSSTQGKQAFWNAYGSACTQVGEPADPSSHFYYFRPQNNDCALLSGQFDPKIAVGATFDLAPSVLQTSGKSPEYKKVWEDGALVLTLLFGTYSDEAATANDVGVQSYNAAYAAVLRYLGRPTTHNVPTGVSPGLEYPDVRLEFRLKDGRRIDLNMMLFKTSMLQNPSSDFRKHYEARTLISDFVSYNGHSGLGANIRALARLGQFTPMHYQIFFVNGCDTFTYVDDALNQAVAAANPGAKGTKYLDLITNALPSLFSGFARNTTTMLAAFLNANQTYRQLLGSFDPSQRALVSGEEDNDS